MLTMFRAPAVSMSMAVLLLVRCGDGAPAGSLGPASYRPVDQVFAAPESFNRTRRDDDDGDGTCDCSGAGCCYCSCSNGCCSDYCNDCEAICDSCPTAPPTPSPTTDRCTADEYDVDGSCYPFTECVVGTTFETNPPTATSNRVCADVKTCRLGFTFQTVMPTATSDRVCGSNVTSACPSGLWATAATLTSDRGACMDCATSCPSGQIVAMQCTVDSNLQCASPRNSADPGDSSSSSSSSSSSISTSDKFLIALMVFLALGVIAYLFHRLRDYYATQFKQKDALHERLLEQNAETQGDLEEAKGLNSRMLAAWQIKSEDVECGAVIAEGAAGKVHTGRYGGHRVAIKVLKQPLDVELDEASAEDYGRECSTLMSIRHAHLVIFFGAGLMPDNRPFMVTEFMALGSLKVVLADRAQELGWSLRTQIAAQVASAMAYLHSLKIVHRDFKSENVLLSDDFDAKVADFGTSKLVTASRTRLQNTGETSFGGGGDDDQTRSVAFQATMTKGVGTPLWMAPELFVGGSKYSTEVDIFSFGMIMWELATRKIPWAEEITDTQYIVFFAALSKALENDERPRVPAEAVEASPGFVALMRQCWATDPTARPEASTVAQLLAGLAEV